MDLEVQIDLEFKVDLEFKIQLEFQIDLEFQVGLEFKISPEFTAGLELSSDQGWQLLRFKFLGCEFIFLGGTRGLESPDCQIQVTGL